MAAAGPIWSAAHLAAAAPQDSTSGDAPPPSHYPEWRAASNFAYPASTSRAAAVLIHERTRSLPSARRCAVGRLSQAVHPHHAKRSATPLRPHVSQLARAVSLSKLSLTAWDNPPALYVCHRDLSELTRGHENAPQDDDEKIRLVACSPYLRSPSRRSSIGRTRGHELIKDRGPRTATSSTPSLIKFVTAGPADAERLEGDLALDLGDAAERIFKVVIFGGHSCDLGDVCSSHGGTRTKPAVVPSCQ